MICDLLLLYSVGDFRIEAGARGDDSYVGVGIQEI